MGQNVQLSKLPSRAARARKVSEALESTYEQVIRRSVCEVELQELYSPSFVGTLAERERVRPLCSGSFSFTTTLLKPTFTRTCSPERLCHLLQRFGYSCRTNFQAYRMKKERAEVLFCCC